MAHDIPHETLQRLYTALNRHDHEAMAACYAPEARFRDIAFDCRNRDEIHKMWRMICCDSNIGATFAIIDADSERGFAGAVFTYNFGASKDPLERGQPVCNPTISTFDFRAGDGLIVRQEDCCDAKAWARQALGKGPRGFLAGRIRLLRSRAAKKKLRTFLDANP